MRFFELNVHPLWSFLLSHVLLNIFFFLCTDFSGYISTFLNFSGSTLLSVASISELTWQGCLSPDEQEEKCRDENYLVAFDLFSLILLFPYLASLKAAHVSDGLWLTGCGECANSITEMSTAKQECS